MRKQIVKKINKYFISLSAQEAGRLSDIFSQEIKRLNIKYFNNFGKASDIKLTLRPWLIKRNELRFFHKLFYAFKTANHKLFTLYLYNKAAQEALPLRQQEKEWFGLINKDRPQKYQVVFGRWDTNISFDDRDNIRDIKFLETNTVGIGGVYYIPVVSQALRAVLKAGVERNLYPCHLGYQPDSRHLLAEEIKLHARFIGRKRLNVAFMENREFLGGTVELPELTSYFLKLGINAILADPRQLRLKGKEVYYKDTIIDVIYRDSELQELIDIEKQGYGMAALKQAFINNQVISSIAGELDHKSGFEIFSSQEFWRFFTSAERKIFKDHVPWTRILKERKTQDVNFHTIDLVPYVIKNKNDLVIKPNRAYGGKGVVIGRLVGYKEWVNYIKKALGNPGGYVVQGLVKIREESFPFFNSKKQIEFDKFYSVAGFVVTRRSAAVLGRFSKEMVVNVARKGGIIPALVF